MAHFLVSDDRYRDVIYGENRRSHPSDPNESAGESLADYRFGKAQSNGARGSLSHVSGYFRRMVEAIANSKLRRMERELELRGIRTRDKG
jgi:hypothetical protein